jgi:aryl sulfotransferase
MQEMEIKLLQIGMPKSGNYWLYNIIQHLYHFNGVESRSFIQEQPVYERAKNWDLSNRLQAGIDMMDIETGQCYYRISSVIREPVADLPEYINRTNHVWTHSEVGMGSLNVLRHFNKWVYIYRDPRDMALSAARFAFTPYMKKYYPSGEVSMEGFLNNHLPEMIHEWTWHILDYLLLKEIVDIHFVSYENLLTDFDKTVGSLADYLGLGLSKYQLKDLRNSVSFKTMKKKDPGHVRKGKHLQWKDVLDRDQQVLVTEFAGDLLLLLGYPVDGSATPQKKDLKISDIPELDIAKIEEVAEKLKYASMPVK